MTRGMLHTHTLRVSSIESDGCQYHDYGAVPERFWLIGTQTTTTYISDSTQRYCSS